MRKVSNNKKADPSKLPDGENKRLMFLEQVVSMKIVLGWGAAIIMTVATASYHVGKWVQETEDKFEFHQKKLEMNDAITQLTLETNDKITKLERENSRLETLIEMYQEKEVKNGK